MCEFDFLLSSASWGQVFSWVHQGQRCGLAPQPSVGLCSVHVNKRPAFPGSPGFSAGISSVCILATTWIDLSMLLRACHVVEAFKERGHWPPWCGVVPSNGDFENMGELLGRVPCIENGSGVGHWGLPMPLNTCLCSVQRLCVCCCPRGFAWGGAALTTTKGGTRLCTNVSVTMRKKKIVLFC